MDIETIREHKKTVEKEIYLMILRLQEETGAKVTGVELHRFHNEVTGQTEPENIIGPFTITMEI